MLNPPSDRRAWPWTRQPCHQNDRGASPRSSGRLPAARRDRRRRSPSDVADEGADLDRRLRALLLGAPAEEAQLDDPVPSFEERCRHLVGARLEQRRSIAFSLVVEPEAADDELEVGAPRAKALREMADMGEPSRRDRADAAHVGAFLRHVLDHLGDEQGNPEDLDPASIELDQLGDHLEGETVDLVAGRTHEDADGGRAVILSGGDGRAVRRGALVAKVIEHLSRRRHRELDVGVGDVLALPVLLGVVERGQQHLVVDGITGISLHVFEDDVGRLVLVPGEEPLVVARPRVQDRLVAHQHHEEAHRRHVLAQDDEAHGQGHGEQEAQGAPQPRPEDHRDEKGDLGKAGALTEEPWLEHHVGAELEAQEQRGHHERLGPPVEGRQADGDREQGGPERADVRDEAQGAREERPQRGVGHAHDEEANAERDAEAAVDDALHEQVAADARSRLVEGLGRGSDPSMADEPDHAIPQRLPLEQHEDHQHGHHAGGGHRLQDARQVDDERGRGLDGDDEWLVAPRRRRSRLLDLAHHVGDGLLHLLDRASAAEASDLGDPPADVGLVARQLGGERRELADEQPAAASRRRKGQQRDHQHRGDPTEPSPVERIGNRAQQEREQAGQGDRDEHGLRPVERGDDQHADHDASERLEVGDNAGAGS